MSYFDDPSSGANYVYNWTADREFGWKASREGNDTTDVRIEGVRCIDPSCNLTDVPDIPISDETKYWSNASTWGNEIVPTGGDVEILPGENIIYDLADSPVFDVLTVNGRLTFLDDAAYLPKLNLNAKHIFVRAGELLIGNDTNPFQAEATITLYGDQSDAQVKMSGTVEAGNKIIANTALVKFYGKPRSRMSRLIQSVTRGDTVTHVDPNLDWQAGEMLYFAPTNHQSEHHEYLEIADYHAPSGQLTVTTPF